MHGPQNTIFNPYLMIIYFPQIILIISNYSNIVTVRHTDKNMAENRSKSQEAAALFCILTQNSAESEGCSSESTRNNNMGNTVRPIQPAPSQQATTSRASIRPVR
jgi:hypothetical protein